MSTFEIGQIIAERLERREQNYDLHYIIEELKGLDEGADDEDLRMVLEDLREWLKDY